MYTCFYCENRFRLDQIVHIQDDEGNDLYCVCIDCDRQSEQDMEDQMREQEQNYFSGLGISRGGPW